MGSPHYPESKMHLRCTASGRTPLGPGLFHLAHRRMPTRNSLSAEWRPRAPRPPLWALYTKILHPELAPTAFCFPPLSLEPVIAWQLQLRAFEGTCSLVLRAILLPPEPGAFKGHGNILQPFTLSQKREGHTVSNKGHLPCI